MQKDIKEINEKYIIFILFCIQFTHILDFVIVMPLGPKFMRYFSIGPKEFSWIVSAYGFSAAIAGILSSFFIDQLDRKTSLIFLYTGFIIGTILCGFSTSHYTLIAARLVAGGFAGVLGALIFSIIGEKIPELRRGAATGAVMSAFGVSSVIGIPLGLYLADTFSWHIPFYFIGAISLFVLLMIIKKMPSMKGHIQIQKSPKLKSFMEVISNANHIRVFLLSIFIIHSGFLVIPFVSPYMVKNVGLLEGQLPFIYFFGGLATIITSRMIGIWSDRIGKHKMFYIVGCLSIIPILIITNLNKVSLPMALIASTIFFILVSGRFVPLMSLITSSVVPKHRGQFMGLNTAIQSSSIAMASAISGYIIKTNQQEELVNFNVVGLISCALTLFCLYLASRVKIINLNNL